MRALSVSPSEPNVLRVTLSGCLIRNLQHQLERLSGPLMADCNSYCSWQSAVLLLLLLLLLQLQLLLFYLCLRGYCRACRVCVVGNYGWHQIQGTLYAMQQHGASLLCRQRLISAAVAGKAEVHRYYQCTRQPECH